MKLLSVITLIAAITPTPPCAGADLDQIQRRILKEPTYHAKPQYCLLVFGAEANTRVWLVRDGDTLYLDANSDAELTAQEQVATGEAFQPVDIRDVKNQTTHRLLELNHDQSGPGGADVIHVSVSARSEYRQFGHCYPSGSPQSAPILHFDGPRTFRLVETPRLFVGQPDELQVAIGTPGLGPGTFVSLDVEAESAIPADVAPLAVLSLPPETAGGPSRRIEFSLPHRC